MRHAARELTGADGATFVLRDGDQCFYADEDAISPLWKGHRFAMSDCISGWAMLNKEAAVSEGIYADGRIPQDAYRPSFVKSLAMPALDDVPIVLLSAPVDVRNAPDQLGALTWLKKPIDLKALLRVVSRGSAAGVCARTSSTNHASGAMRRRSRVGRCKAASVSKTNSEIRRT